MLSLSCLCFALGACGQRFSNENLNVVNRQFDRAEEQSSRGIRDAGVTPKEVESILGPPTRTETTRLSLETQKKEVDVIRYYYQQDGQTIELHFLDNKLISKVPLLGAASATPIPEKAQP